MSGIQVQSQHYQTAIWAHWRFWPRSSISRGNVLPTRISIASALAATKPGRSTRSSDSTAWGKNQQACSRISKRVLLTTRMYRLLSDRRKVIKGLWSDERKGREYALQGQGRDQDCPFQGNPAVVLTWAGQEMARPAFYEVEMATLLWWLKNKTKHQQQNKETNKN